MLHSGNISILPDIRDNSRYPRLHNISDTSTLFEIAKNSNPPITQDDYSGPMRLCPFLIWKSITENILTPATTPHKTKTHNTTFRS